MLYFRHLLQICIYFIFLVSHQLTGLLGIEKKAEPEVDTAAASNLIAIVSLSQKLSEGYIDLKDKLKNIQRLTEDNQFNEELREQLNDTAAHIREFEKDDSTTYGEFLDTRLELKTMRYNLQRRMEPVDDALADISSLQTKWSEDKKDWDKLISAFGITSSKMVQSLISKTDNLISDAFALISEKLDIVVSEKLTGGELDEIIYRQISEVDALISERRAAFNLGESPVMFTPGYFRQFNTELFQEVIHGLDDMSFPGKDFFSSEWSVILLQIMTTFFIAGLIFYFRFYDEETNSGNTLQNYPFSLGITLSVLIGIFLYNAYPPFWHICIMLIGWSAAGRLFRVFIKGASKRSLVYWLIFSLIASTIFEYISFPSALYNLYLLLISLLGVFYSYVCLKEERQGDDSALMIMGFAILSLTLLVISILVILGFSEFSNLLFKLSIRAISVALIARLFVYIAKGAIYWLVYRSPLKESSFFVSQGAYVITKTITLIYLLAFSLVLIVSLVSWNVFDTPLEVVDGISSLGISIGNYRLTVGMVVSAILIIYGAYLSSWGVQTLMKENFFQMMNVAPDVGQSVAKIIHYTIMTLSFFLVLLLMGFSLTNLTIIAGSLGIGVGLGLQDIVKNFAAGVLLLFERPIRVGDTIEFDGGPCLVKRIGLRSTLIKTKSETEIVIPNNDLISHPLTNWTLSQKLYRLKFPIGVAYNSDVAEVMRIMKECGEGCQGVLKTFTPQVVFMGFGESALNFEMRVWIYDVQHRRSVQTEINQELEKRFRMAGISIAYPQLDVHIIK